MLTATTPSAEIDIYDDRVLRDPYPVYRELRDTGAAVYLTPLQVWVFPRFAEVRGALAKWRTFSSIDGPGYATELNQPGLIVSLDPPEHTALRSVLSARLTPRALRGFHAEIEQRAERLVEELVERGSFCAVADLAMTFPVSVVADLIGIPQEGRGELMAWSDASFNQRGGRNSRTFAANDLVQTINGYIVSVADRLTPGSLGADLFAAADEGRITREQAGKLMFSYLVAGMDTTMNAIGAAVYLFAEHPEQWDVAREDRTLLPNAFEEVLRMETPLQVWFRTATQDFETEDATVPAGARVGMMFGSANRDERKWGDPERFDVARQPLDHVAFGFGIHGCAGMELARIEGRCLLAAMASRIRRFEIGEPTWRVNNVLRGLAALPTTVVPA